MTMLNNTTTTTRCGFIAIVGRPNVGKSSLLNAILGQKVSITSFKPQTTRDQILGIKTTGNTQTVFVDTPGIHIGSNKALNKQMNRIARQALSDVNGVIFVVEAMKFTNEDQLVCDKIAKMDCPIIIALNKVDTIKDKTALLGFMQKLATELPNAQIVPISALKKIQIDTIESLIESYIPESPFYFDKDQVTDKPERFQLSEIIREKLFQLLEKEIPYSIFVEIENLEKEEKIIRVDGLIWVEREGQKAIVVGDKGHNLREVGTRARLEMERYYDKKVCLKLWVKVKDDWSQEMSALKNLGYIE